MPGWAAGIGISPVAEGFDNSIGAGLSAGFGLSKDSWLWGWSADYARVLSDKWNFNAALTWDRDTESRPQGDKVEDSYGITLALTRKVNDKLYIGGGLGHGMYEKTKGDSN